MKKGFTLIELLVVVAIIGMLSSVVLSSLNAARANARDARRIQDARQALTALDLYYNVHNSYPLGNSSQNGNGCTGTSWEQGTCLKVTEDELVPNYIGSIPVDPLYGHTPTGYRYCGGGQYFDLLLWSEKTGSWCNVQHGANFPTATCWMGANGVPSSGWCNDEI